MIRIATVAYLNARPLTSRIDRERFEVIEGVPADIAAALASGRADVALVPVAAVLTDGDYRVLGHACIGAEGPVHSVLLVAQAPPEQWTEVVLDGVSRTSVTLARLLLTRGPLAERVRSDLVIRDGAQGEGLASAGGTVAGLVIGDAARRVPEALNVRLDLAELWTDWTGLPFVFAVWAGRPDLPAAARAHLIQAAREGLAAREQDFEGADLDYVTRSIRYDFDDRALVGLRRYAALAARDGLVGSEHLSFYDPPRRTLARPNLDALLVRAAEGATLTAEELGRLASDASIGDLGAAARERAGSALDGQARVRWTPARRIQTTNIDVGGAPGSVAPGQTGGIVLTADEVHDAAREAAEVDAGEVHLVGGLHPGLGVEAWCRWIRAAREASSATVRALDLDGLRHLCAVDEQPVAQVLDRLRTAGLDGLASGAVLALDDAVRSRVAPDRLSARGWLGLASVVAGAGLPLVVGLEYGAGETQQARLDHLLALRALHASTGGITAFRLEPLRPERGLDPVGATAQDHVRWVALARLALDGVASHQAAWLHVAPGLAQASLHAGADTLGPVALPPRTDQDDNPFVNPRAMAGAKRAVDPWEVFCAEVAYHLKRAGFVSDRFGADERAAPPVASPSVPRPTA